MSDLVGNPEDRFTHDAANLMTFHVTCCFPSQIRAPFRGAAVEPGLTTVTLL